MNSYDKKPERIGFLVMLAGYAAMVTKTLLFPVCL